MRPCHPVPRLLQALHYQVVLLYQFRSPRVPLRVRVPPYHLVRVLAPRSLRRLRFPQVPLEAQARLPVRLPVPRLARPVLRARARPVAHLVHYQLRFHPVPRLAQVAHLHHLRVPVPVIVRLLQFLQALRTHPAQVFRPVRLLARAHLNLQVLQSVLAQA